MLRAGDVKHPLTGRLKDLGAQEGEEAREAGMLGFMARSLVMATLPHRDPGTREFERQNGNLTLTMMVPSRGGGLPYGTLPRLVLLWLTTEAVRTRERVLEVGPSLASFMRELGLYRTGGKRGDITRLKDQTRRLFSTAISIIYEDESRCGVEHVSLVDGALLWWHPGRSHVEGDFESTVTLTEKFFDEVVTRPVPIDLRAIKFLKRSPLALDVYCWLTYRMSYLKAETEIPWEYLQRQFGAGYPETAQGQRNFRKKLKGLAIEDTREEAALMITCG